MKTIIFFISLLFCYSASSQSLTLFDIDDSDYPRMKAKFYAIDADGNQVRPADSELSITENGVERLVTNVSCPVPQAPRNVSIAMSIDVSGSMASEKIDEVPVELGKTTARELCKLVAMPPSEFALQTCDNKALILQDFTTNKPRILSSIDPIQAIGGNDFDEHLLNNLSGLLSIAKNGKNRRFAVIYTDAWWYQLTPEELEECKKICNTYDITFFAVIYSRPESEPNGIKASLQELADFTGGMLYDGITSTEAALDISRQLQTISQGADPCQIEWETGPVCTQGNINVNLQWGTQKSSKKYTLPPSGIAKLDIEPTYISFGKRTPSSINDTTIRFTTMNSGFTIIGITRKYGSDNFELIDASFPIRLDEGQSTEIKLRFAVSDSSFNFASFEVETDICPAYFSANNGSAGRKMAAPTLKLTQPNGGETFVVGSDTIITWEGISPIDTCRLEYSKDNGVSWQMITHNATNLKHKWLDIPLPQSTECLIKISQLPTKSSADTNDNLLATLSGHNRDVNHISWSPDGNRVATSSWDETGKIWDANSGELIHTLSEDIFLKHRDRLRHISWSPNGTRVATASSDDTGKIWDANTGQLTHTLSDRNGDVNHISWSPDGTRVATASWDKTGKIWDANTGQLTHTLYGHYSDVNQISWSPDGNRVAAASGDETGKIWDANSGESIHTLYGHSRGVVHISWSPDGTRVATASSDDTGKIWDANTGELIHTLSEHKRSVAHISWSPDGNRVATASSDETGMIWDANTGEVIHTLSGHIRGVNHISWSPDGNRVATASGDNTGKIWDVNTGKVIYTLEGHNDDVTHISWSPDGNRAATASWDDTGKIWFVGSDIIQSDQSDAVFSIVAPEPISYDVNMLQELVGESKDSVVVGFVENIGSWDFSVDSIYFRGADAEAFSLVSGIPEYQVAPNQTHYGEFRFTPTRVGVHNAEIVIITQSDTLIQSITGVGVQPQLAVNADLLNFGEVEIGDESVISDTILLHNIGSQPIEITNTVKMSPDIEQFDILDGGGGFTLAAGEEREMTLRFKPRYGGRTSGRIGFEYEGVGSPATVRLFGTGIGGMIVALIDSAYIGEEIEFALQLGNIKPEGLKEMAQSFSVDMAFQSTVLTPSDRSLITNIQNDTITISIKGDLTESQNLATVQMLTGLGSVEETDIMISNFKLYDQAGNVVDYDMEYELGNFKSLGICHDGGTRLFNPNTKVFKAEIIPNPASDNITINFELIEDGGAELMIYDNTGQIVHSTIIDMEIGRGSLDLDLSHISAGVYTVILQSPSIREALQLMIVR